MVALLLIILGIIVYYVVPLTYTFQDLGVFMRIFSVILLAMILGQVLLTQGLDFLMEQFFVSCLMWGSDKKLRFLVHKNLSGHRGRNKKTATVFTLCLGFVIFAATVFTLQASSITLSLQWTNGADVVSGLVSSNQYSNSLHFPPSFMSSQVVSASEIDDSLPEAALRTYLDQRLVNAAESTSSTLATEMIVMSYTFITFPLSATPNITKIQLSALAPVSSQAIEIYGVEENLQETVFNEFVIAGAQNPDIRLSSTNGTPDLIASLYSASVNTTGLTYVPPPVYFLCPSFP